MKKRPTTAQKNDFQKTVYAYYHAAKRDLPWRPPALMPNKNDVLNPYYVLVSEIMLQQTQASRVKEKFTAFIKVFPTLIALSTASQSEVLKQWQGLGYNRRGLWLHQAAKQIVQSHDGVIPTDPATLQNLKGIGPYTARSIPTFAYNHWHPFIETNIRDVIIAHFYSTKKEVSDDEMLQVVSEVSDTNNPRLWMYALMDYGAHIKKTRPKVKRQSKHFAKQSTFKGSNRELRANILRYLLAQPASAARLAKELSVEKEKVKENLDTMTTEGLLTKKGRHWSA